MAEIRSFRRSTQRRGLQALLVGITIIAVACSGEGRPNHESSVIIEAYEYGFTAPERIAAGPARVRLVNKGGEEHMALLLHLDEGATQEDFEQAVRTGNVDALFSLGEYTGGPLAGSGGASEAVLDLRPGQYLLLCFVTAPDGVQHVAKGMLRPLEIVGEGSEPLDEQRADVTVRQSEFAFDAPASLTAGTTEVRVVNEGTQTHEMAIYGPGGLVGGIAALAPGRSGVATLVLSAGEYTVLCGVPDPSSGKPHVQLGMVRPLHVE